MRRKKITWQWFTAAMITLLVFAVPTFSGDLNPSAPLGPTMKTLDQISPTWDQIMSASARFKLVMGGAGVLDKETGLVWEQSPSTATRYANGALYACYQKVVGGRSGWRLPSVEELATLVDTSVSGSPKLPTGHPFSNVQSYYYWSSTPNIYTTGYTWFVDFSNGAVDYGTTAFYANVWCVRGGHG